MQPDYCIKHAPPIFFVKDGISHVVTGCCNSWECPRCGKIRAKQEYAKMVYGANKLADDGHDLYFITLTCRGQEMPLSEAEENYYRWTTKLLNACRNECKRRGDLWAYVQVTERQKRLHPHSHLITTYLPKNSRPGKKIIVPGKTRDVILSDWFERRCVSAGLGNQYEITKVKSAKGVANYVAKYLFKDAMATRWPRGWRRIRYSRTFPKDFEVIHTEFGFPVLSKGDWRKIRDFRRTVHVNSVLLYHDAKTAGIERVVIDK